MLAELHNLPDRQAVPVAVMIAMTRVKTVTVVHCKVQPVLLSTLMKLLLLPTVTMLTTITHMVNVIQIEVQVTMTIISKNHFRSSNLCLISLR